jgi:ribonuclease HII
MSGLLPYLNKGAVEAGCDEAGRGCIAGPVVASAVILPGNYNNNILNDSKKLTEKQRSKLRIEIERDAIAWAVEFISPSEIDKINILNASFLAMQRAVDKLKVMPEFLLIDGNRFNKHKEIPHECIVKGDGKYLSIAAASILAKTHRDEYMEKLSLSFPHYLWAKNKGYPTPEHKLAVCKYGICEHHRKSYKLNFQTKIDFSR